MPTWDTTAKHSKMLLIKSEKCSAEATWEEQASLKDELQDLASDLNIAEVELSQKRDIVLGEIDEKFEVLRLALEAKKEELKAKVVAHAEERLQAVVLKQKKVLACEQNITASEEAYLITKSISDVLSGSERDDRCDEDLHSGYSGACRLGDCAFVAPIL